MAQPAENLEHQGQHAIASLNRLEHDRGRIPSKDLRLAVYKWFEHAHPGDQKQIAFILTGKEDGAINNEKPDVNLFLYYLWTQFSADLHEAVRMFQASDEREQGRIAAAITGNPDGEIDFEDSEIKQRFLEFYEERTELSEHGQMVRAFETLLLRFSKKVKYEDEEREFKPPRFVEPDEFKAEKFDEEPLFDPKLSSADDILGEAYSARHAAKKDAQDTARRNLIVQMSRLGAALSHYRIDPPEMLRGVIQNPEVLFDPENIKIGDFGNCLREVLKTVDERKKADEKARKEKKEAHDERVRQAKRAYDEEVKRMRDGHDDRVKELKREHDRTVKDKRERIAKRLKEPPVSADQATFVCMREEIEAQGKSGDDLGRLAASSFARFAVAAESRDFGGDKPKKRRQLFGVDVDFGEDIKNLGRRVRFSEVLRGSGAALLTQFPYFRDLNLSSAEHDIRHRFEKVDAKTLAEFISVITNKAAMEREDGVSRGITMNHLAGVQTIVRILEDMLAEKIAEQIGHGEDAWKQVPQALRESLREPMAHVGHDPKKAEARLKTLNPPKDEHKPEGVVDEVRKKIGLLGHISSVATFFDHLATRWAGKRATPKATPEKPEGKPGGSH